MENDKEKMELYYQKQAAQIVDFLFDNDFFAADLSRDGMQGVEDLLAFYLQTTAKMAAKTAVLVKKFKNKQED